MGEVAEAEPVAQRHQTAHLARRHSLEHSILIALWNMLTNGVFYDDLGADYYSRLNPERTKQRALN